MAESTGLVVAFVGLYAAQATGNPVYDGVAAIVIGVLPMGFAVLLAWENKRLILGESLPADQERALTDAVCEYGSVRSVRDFHTVFFGQNHVVVTADVAFDDGLSADQLDEELTGLEAALRELDDRITEVYVEPLTT